MARFASITDMFDPRQNVIYAAQLLQKLRISEGSWTAAIARYHASPQNSHAQANYVCAVIKNMIASGFGSSTPQSRAFCKL
jgi:soluble lytic murein transglycosylase-like protein